METGPLAIFILNLLVGAVLLTAGRQFFWLFVGCIGFAAGLQYAPGLWDITSPLLLILLSIVTGIVGALLSVIFQKIAIGLAGFAGGGFMAVNLLRFLDLESETLFWLSYIVGGIIGAILLFMVFQRLLKHKCNLVKKNHPFCYSPNSNYRFYHRQLFPRQGYSRKRKTSEGAGSACIAAGIQ